MCKLRIKEAIAYATLHGRSVTRREIAARLFPGRSVNAADVGLSNLINGKTKRIKPEWLTAIADMCGCSVEFLLKK